MYTELFFLTQFFCSNNLLYALYNQINRFIRSKFADPIHFRQMRSDMSDLKNIRIHKYVIVILE